MRERAVRQASEEAEFKPETVACISFEARSEVLDYLGYRHVTGVEDGNPLRRLVPRPTRAARWTATRHRGSRGPRARGRSWPEDDYVRRLLDTLDVYDSRMRGIFSVSTSPRRIFVSVPQQP